MRPYFQPGDSGVNPIAYIDAAPYGPDSEIPYDDSGYDYDPAGGTQPRVQVVGDVANNYFWGVEGRAGTGSGIINWVGEFDFALTKGN